MLLLYIGNRKLRRDLCKIFIRVAVTQLLDYVTSLCVTLITCRVPVVLKQVFLADVRLIALVMTVMLFFFASGTLFFSRSARKLSIFRRFHAVIDGIIVIC